MSEKDKLLPDLDIGVKAKSAQKMTTDVPDELPVEDDEKTDTDTGTDDESDSDTDSDTDSEYECKVCDMKFSGYRPLKQHKKGKKHAKMILKKKKERKLKKDGLEYKDNDEDLIPEPFTTCETCEKQFSGPEAFQMHLESKKHKQKVSVASILSQFREKGEINTEKLTEFYKNKITREDVPQNAEDKNPSLVLKSEDKNSSEEFECKECGKVFSGLIPFSIHLTSKTHAKQLEKMNMLHKIIPEPETSDEVKESNLSSLSEEDGILVCKICSMSFSGPESAMMHLKSKNHSKTLDRYVRKLKKKQKNLEAKELESNSERKERKVKPEGENEDKTANEEASMLNPSMKPDTPDNPTGGDETAKSVDSLNVKEELESYEKYKKYKELMNSLKDDDKVLK